jgi:hypothetical protein
MAQVRYENPHVKTSLSRGFIPIRFKPVSYGETRESVPIPLNEIDYQPRTLRLFQALGEESIILTAAYNKTTPGGKVIKNSEAIHWNEEGRMMVLHDHSTDPNLFSRFVRGEEEGEVPALLTREMWARIFGEAINKIELMRSAGQLRVRGHGDGEA